jgi:hypothetical protein
MVKGKILSHLGMDMAQEMENDNFDLLLSSLRIRQLEDPILRLHVSTSDR